MFSWLRDRLCELLRVPPRPHPPRGTEGSLRVFRAAEAYYIYRVIGWALGFGASLAVLVVLIAFEARFVEEAMNDPSAAPFTFLVTGGFVLAKSLVVLQGLVSFLTLRLDYDLRWYMVTDMSLRIREGIWTVHEMTMTLANIQNISLNQGPVQRLLGISDLEVQSAGGGQTTPQKNAHAMSAAMHTGRFRGIADAEEVRDLMLARMREAKGSGLGEREMGEGGSSPPVGAPPLWDSEPVRAALAELLGEARELRLAAAARGGTGTER